MQMGAFRKRTGYQQENAMDNANVLMGLQKMMGENIDSMTNQVDEYGKSRVRNSVSELMGTDEFKNADPATAQAMIAGMSGGRDLGENFMKTLKMSDDNKGDIQGQAWDESDATKLFDRSMAKQAQGHANSISLAGINNKARQKLYGDTGGTSLTSTSGGSQPLSTQMVKMKKDNLIMENLLKTEKDPKIRAEIQARLYETRLQAEVLMSKTKIPAGGKGKAVNGLFGTSMGGSGGASNSAGILKSAKANGYIQKRGKDTYLLDDSGNWTKSKGDAMTLKYAQMRS